MLQSREPVVQKYGKLHAHAELVHAKFDADLHKIDVEQVAVFKPTLKLK